MKWLKSEQKIKFGVGWFCVPKNLAPYNFKLLPASLVKVAKIVCISMYGKLGEARHSKLFANSLTNRRADMQFLYQI